jgi:hypothetical protein
LDPHGDFATEKSLDFFMFNRTLNTADVIKAELLYVRQEADEMGKKLEYASDVQIGMEILHKFILDLLGRWVSLRASAWWVFPLLIPLSLSFSAMYTFSLRTTPAAKIFSSKSSEDFRYTMVVTKVSKAIAWAAVILLNLVFVYFSILKGYVKGLEWQVEIDYYTLYIPPRSPSLPSTKSATTYLFVMCLCVEGLLVLLCHPVNH